MPRHHKSPKKVVIWSISLLVTFLLTFLLSLIFKKTLKELAYFRNIKTIRQLKEENTFLKEELLKLKSSMFTKQELIVQNKRLRKMLSLKEQHPQVLVSTIIINKNPSSWRKEILIDIGTDHNIQVGDPVIDFNTHLIGRVARVGSHQSWVRLISDPNFKIIVNCQGLSTLLVGALFEGAKLLYVPYDFSIQKDDEVTIVDTNKSNLTLAVGKVSSVGKSPSCLTQQVFVRPYTDLSQLKEVFVVKQR